jgi:hypothetical protein
MSEDAPIPTGRRGRPRVEEPLERVSTRLPLPIYDELVRKANARDTSVSMMVRQLLILRLKP